MADNASVVIQATVLPDEIQKTFSSTTSVTPADGTEKWYYKLTSVGNTSDTLIAGYFTDYTAVNSSTAPDAVVGTDKVLFLFVKNTDAAETVYITLDAGVVTSSTGDALVLGPSESLAIRCPNATVADITAISSAGTVECLVAALIDDI